MYGNKNVIISHTRAQCYKVVHQIQQSGAPEECKKVVHQNTMISPTRAVQQSCAPKHNDLAHQCNVIKLCTRALVTALRSQPSTWSSASSSGCDSIKDLCCRSVLQHFQPEPRSYHRYMRKTTMGTGLKQKKCFIKLKQQQQGLVCDADKFWFPANSPTAIKGQ